MIKELHFEDKIKTTIEEVLMNITTTVVDDRYISSGHRQNREKTTITITSTITMDIMIGKD